MSNCCSLVLYISVNVVYLLIEQAITLEQRIPYLVCEGCQEVSVFHQFSSLFSPRMLNVLHVFMLPGVLPTRSGFAVPWSPWRCSCSIQLRASTRPKKCTAAGGTCGGVHEVSPQRCVDSRNSASATVYHVVCLCNCLLHKHTEE